MILLVGAAFAAADLELALARFEAAEEVGDELGARRQAAAALKLDPHEPRAHLAWQRAMADVPERLEKEYTALAASSDPDLRLAAAAWSARRAGQALPAVPGASPGLWARSAATVDLARGRADLALTGLVGVEGDAAAELRLRALQTLDDVGGMRRECAASLERWPDRPDLCAPLFREDDRRLKPTKRSVVEAAKGLSGALGLYRAREVLALAGETEAAAAAAASLAAAGEPWALGSRPAWTDDMILDLGRILALTPTPRPPEGGNAEEEARVLAAAAREQERRGSPSASATWREATVRTADPELVLEGALALERLGAPPAELAPLARRAIDGILSANAGDGLADALLLESRCALALGDSALALQDATLAARVGNAPEAWAQRGRCLEAMGRPEYAFDAWTRALEGGHPEAEAALARLYDGPARWQDLTGTVEAAPVAVTSPFARHLDGDPAVVAIWASWCGPCRQELPVLDALAAKHPEVDFVAVSVDDRAADAEKFTRQHPIPHMRVVWDPALGRALRVRAIPTTFVLDSAGQIVAVHQGYGPDEAAEIEAEISGLK